MTLQEAKQALRAGKAIAHRHFTDEEYIRERNGRAEFEDGVPFSWVEFFKWRNEQDYADDWRIVTVLTNEPEPIPFTNPYERKQKEMERIMSIPETYRRGAPKIGRNDPCHCGSGKKFKKCCHG